MTLYGITSALLAYCASIWMKSPLTAFATVAGYQLVVFLVSACESAPKAEPQAFAALPGREPVGILVGRPIEKWNDHHGSPFYTRSHSPHLQLSRTFYCLMQVSC